MTDNQHQELASLVGALIEGMHRQVDASSFDLVMQTELTLTQLRVLMILSGAQQPRPIFEIAEELGLSLATAGRAVDHLVRHNFARRWEDPEDRRSKLVELTDRGSELTQAPQDAARAHLATFAADLPADIADELATALRRALEASSYLSPTPAGHPSCLTQPTDH